MMFLFHCTDKPNAVALRMATRPEHLKYVEANKDKFVFAGAILAEDGATMIGSLVVLELPDRAAAEAYAAADPYAKAKLFESVVIRPVRHNPALGGWR